MVFSEAQINSGGLLPETSRVLTFSRLLIPNSTEIVVLSRYDIGKGFLKVHAMLRDARILHHTL